MHRLIVPVALTTPTSRTPAQQFILRASNLSSGTIAKAERHHPPTRLHSGRPPTAPYHLRQSGGGDRTRPRRFQPVSVRPHHRPGLPHTISGIFSTSNIASAVAGQDYTAVRTTWTIGAGARATRVGVPILSDNIQEGRERFRATASITSGNATFTDGTRVATATGLIDNRVAGVTLAVSDFTVANRGDTANVRVFKTGTTTETIYYTASTYGTDSAVAGEEYNRINNLPQSIAPNATFDTFPITTLVPTEDKGITNFGVRIGSPRGATISDATGIVTYLLT